MNDQALLLKLLNKQLLRIAFAIGSFFAIFVSYKVFKSPMSRFLDLEQINIIYFVVVIFGILGLQILRINLLDEFARMFTLPKCLLLLWQIKINRDVITFDYSDSLVKWDGLYKGTKPERFKTPLMSRYNSQTYDFTPNSLRYFINQKAFSIHPFICE